MFMSEDLDPEDLKKEANTKWANGEIEDANAIWRQALKECIKYSMRGYPTKKNRDMQLSLRLNLSLYHYKKKEYSDCINQCNIIVENLINLEDILSYYENESSCQECNEEEQTEGKKKGVAMDEETSRATDECCSRYIIKKDTLIKIFLRRASAFLHVQDYDKCRENITLIRRVDKQNEEAINLEKKMCIDLSIYEQKQRELYRKMCSMGLPPGKDNVKGNIQKEHKM
ncbi:conserved Plasmodium protein, unknown function [Plasmodium malariae]|uniref:Tetratricopeptide repeat protein n=1 Tax=Plasmodium malariae TaxID=5858 RepID=A0A1C3KA87_PLAMA|nr:conserved Plasmodium protein, unknown function [Plasmodium malariae]